MEHIFRCEGNFCFYLYCFVRLYWGRNGLFKRGGWIWCDARVVITKEEASEFNRFSLVSMFNNGVSFLVYIIDVFLIGVITEDMNVLASYKTATLIPLL